MKEKKCHCIDCFNSWTQNALQPLKCSSCGNMNPNNMLIFDGNGTTPALPLTNAKASVEGIPNPARPAYEKMASDDMGAKDHACPLSGQE